MKCKLCRDEFRIICFSRNFCDLIYSFNVLPVFCHYISLRWKEMYSTEFPALYAVKKVTWGEAGQTLTHLGRCMKRHVVSLRGSGTRSQFCHFSRLNRFKLFTLWYQKAPRNSWFSIQDVCLLPHTLCETKVSYYYNCPTDVAIFVSRWHSGGVNYGPPLDVDSHLLLLVKENHHNPNLAFQVM